MIGPQNTQKILSKLINVTIIDTIEANHRTEPRKDNKYHQERLFDEQETPRSKFANQVQLSGKTDQRKKDSTIEKTKLSISN